MLQKLPEGREGWVQPAKPGALAENVMLEQKPEGGQWLRRKAGWAQEAGSGQVGAVPPLAPGACEQARLARMKSKGMGRPLMMRLLFPGGSRGPRG